MHSLTQRMACVRALTLATVYFESHVRARLPVPSLALACDTMRVVCVGVHPDGLNVHGKFGVIASIASDRLSLEYSHGAGPDQNSALMAFVGDTLTFRARNSFQQYASSAIKAIDTQSWTVTLEDALPARAAVGDLFEAYDWIPTFVAVRVRVVVLVCAHTGMSLSPRARGGH